MPSVLSAIQVALIYLTEINFDLTGLKWCLLKAGRKPDPTEVPGPEVLCEIRNEPQVTTSMSDLYKFALSIRKPNKMR